MRYENTFELSAEQVAKRIGIPLSRWPGNCFGIATELVEQGLVEGDAVYGHWLGPVARGSMFHGGDSNKQPSCFDCRVFYERWVEDAFNYERAEDGAQRLKPFSYANWSAFRKHIGWEHVVPPRYVTPERPLKRSLTRQLQRP